MSKPTYTSQVEPDGTRFLVLPEEVALLALEALRAQGDSAKDETQSGNMIAHQELPSRPTINEAERSIPGGAEAILRLSSEIRILGRRGKGVGPKIRLLRELALKGLRETARAVGIMPATLHNIEMGHSLPHEKTFSIILTFLEQPSSPNKIS